MIRQVPHYLIIGNGRVARHFQFYFSQLNLSLSSWQRSEALALLHERAQQASHILVLIQDQAIDEFVTQHLQQTTAVILHCSGSLVSQRAWGAHPLMTFNETLYTLEQYHKIPFILDHDAPDFAAMLPGIPNQHVRLPTALKAKYHALCVLGGNFSSILWHKLFSDFENELGLPPEIAHPYLLQLMQNLLQNPASALTGPLVRNDKKTIEKNIAALTQDPFQDIYKSFVACYEKITQEVT